MTQVTITHGPEWDQWIRTFDNLAGEMADRLVPRMELVLSDCFKETQALVHVYPEGASGLAKEPPRRRDIESAGRLKASGYHEGARRQGDEVVDAIGYTAYYAEFERLGTKRSIPPYRQHDFMAPWVPAMDRIEQEMVVIWEELWR